MTIKQAIVSIVAIVFGALIASQILWGIGYEKAHQDQRHYNLQMSCQQNGGTWDDYHSTCNGLKGDK